MGELFTDEIDLRPMWRRGLAKPAPPRWPASAGRQREWAIRLGFVALGAALAIAVRGPSDRSVVTPTQRAVPAVASEPTPAPAIAPDPPPIAATLVPDAKVIDPPPEESVALVAPPVARTGKLVLASEPAVSVYVGERRLGRTPLTVNLEAGKQRLRFVSRKRHLDEARTFRIRAGKTHEREVVFGISRLYIDAPPRAKVYIGKRYVGRAPIKPLDIVEGRHRIKVVQGKRRHSERLYIPPSREVRYRVDL